MKRLHIFVSGMVQGVFFRQSTAMKAREFGLKGWVRNQRDGRVELVCEGNEDSLHTMIAWCEKGPKGAFVDSVDTRWEEFNGEFNNFKIVY
ncbi:MAG: acylphosphatase [Proteobacteria bacterium]|nr:acylphosphatase [Pseudomonadota bacterium]